MKPAVMGQAALAFALAALIAACSQDTPREGAAAQRTTTQDAPARSVSASPAAEAARTTTPGALAATTGPLKGAVSPLNTRITAIGTIIDLPSDTLFEYDKATLTPKAGIELNKAAAMIRQSPAGPILLIGHTDSKGEEVYNQTLSDARARTVADWFGRQVGVRQREFRVSGRGESDPIAPNQNADGSDDPAGRAKNRRVEVVIPTAAG